MIAIEFFLEAINIAYELEYEKNQFREVGP